jgi:hypothetical protein
MKKLYRGCIWVIILLPIMASQSVFATQTIQGEWEQTALANNVWDILENNTREEIIESQYAFTLTSEADVTATLTAFADTFVYLFLINSIGQLELVDRVDGDGTYINSVYYGESVIQKILSSGDYFIVPTTYSPETYIPPKAYILEITIVSNSGSQLPQIVTVNSDSTQPVITLNGDAEVSHELGMAYSDAAAAANDDTDGDISSSIVTTGEVNAQSPGTYTLTYTVSDSAGNAADPVTRQVVVADSTQPVITLNGDAEVSHELGMAYTDATAAANDNTDGDISSSIVTTGEVNAQSSGTYKLTYTVSDSAGNAADPVTRSVRVFKFLVTISGRIIDVEETPVNQVEETPVNQVEETPVNQAEETPVNQAEETPVNQVEETPVDQVEETPVDQVEETPVNQVEETPVNQVEENNIDSASAPSSSRSSVKLSQSVLYQKGDKAVITINALNNEGKLLDDVELSVKCIFCLGVEIGQFTQTKPGIYEATITSGRQISFGFIEAELTNEFGSAKLAPQKLNVIYRPSGGCTVAANGRSDISLFLMLILLTTYNRRKKLKSR